MRGGVRWSVGLWVEGAPKARGASVGGWVPEGAALLLFSFVISCYGIPSIRQPWAAVLAWERYRG